MHPQAICPNCRKFVINHLPWELNACYEKQKAWYDTNLNLPKSEQPMLESDSKRA